MSNPQPQIDKLTPDYPRMLNALAQHIVQFSSWKDLYEGGTGTTFLELIAGVGAYNQFGITTAARERFMHTAVRRSSVYAHARTLGTRIGRKLPAVVQVVLTRTGASTTPLVIPSYSVWQVGDREFFNRQPIVFPANVANLNQIDKVHLYEGQVVYKNDLSVQIAGRFNEFYLNTPDFTVSDLDTSLFVDGTEWTRTADAVWLFGSTDPVFYDNTAGNGDATVLVGNGVQGRAINPGQLISVRYVVTEGARGNRGVPSLEVKASTFPAVRGLTVTAVGGGSDEKDAAYYKFVAPHQFRANRRAVNPDDYVSIPLSYPGVADVYALGQRNIAPNDVRWMNVVRLIILPQSSDGFTPLEKADFQTWFADKRYTALDIDLTVNPVPVNTDVVLNVFVYSNADIPDSKAQITERITALFSKRLGTLGRTVAHSDITEACDLPDVDYTDVVSPTTDIIPSSPAQFAKLRDLVLNVQYTTRRRNTGLIS